MGRLIGLTDPKGNITRIVLKASGVPETVQMPEATDISYSYDQNGNILSTTDAEGNVTGYTWDVMERLQSVIDPQGNLTEISYDKNGNRKRITAPLGEEISFIYDKNDRLISQINAEGEQTVYNYDRNGNISSLIDPNGGVTEYTYDILNRLTEVKDPLGNITQYSYDKLGNVTQVEDPSGAITMYEYTDVSQLKKIIDPAGAETVLEYNGMGLVGKIQNTLGNVYEYKYNLHGQVGEILDPLGGVTKYSYDINNNLSSVQNALGKITSYGYDDLDRLISVTDPLNNQTIISYDKNNNTTEVKDANGNVTNYIYDSLNQLTQIQEPGGALTKYIYDESGNLKGVTDANGNTTWYAYDKSGNLVTVEDPQGNQDNYSYDSNGNLISHTKPDGTTIEYVYDLLNRLTEIIYPDGTGVKYSYDSVGNRTSMEDSSGVTHYSYDRLNRLTGVTNSSEESIAYSYDLLGRQTGLTYPDGKDVQYIYDEMDRLKSVTDWTGSSTNYLYDTIGRRTETQLPDGLKTLYSFDDANRLTELKNLDGETNLSTFSYLYDNVGNITQEILNYRSEAEEITNYVYDGRNQLTHVNKNNGESVSYAYDPAGNKIQESQVKAGETKETTNYIFNTLNQLTGISKADGYIAEYEYDQNGNRIKLTEPGHRKTEYTWDFEDRLLSVFQYRAKSNDAEIEPEALEKELSSQKDREALQFVASLDNMPVIFAAATGKGNSGNKGSGNENAPGQLKKQELKEGIPATTPGLPGLPQQGSEQIYQTFSYDGDGNRLQSTALMLTVSQGVPAEDEIVVPESNETGIQSNTSFSINRLPLLAYAGNDFSFLTVAAKGGNGNGNGNSGSDGNNGNGNGNSKINDNGSDKVKENDNGLHKGWYKKNGAGGGVEIPLPEEITEETYFEYNYVTDINRAYPEVLMVSNENGDYTASYLYGLERISVRSEEAAGEPIQPDRYDPLYYLNDGLGSVAQLVNGNGEVWNKFSYDPYGKPSEAGKLLQNRNKEELINSPYGFTGEAHDLFNGLIYLRARYYDPNVGSFISRDSYLGDIANPLSQNRYTYAENNPVNYTDPSGYGVDKGTGLYLNSGGIPKLVGTANDKSCGNAINIGAGSIARTNNMASALRPTANTVQIKAPSANSLVALANLKSTNSLRTQYYEAGSVTLFSQSRPTLAELRGQKLDELNASTLEANRQNGLVDDGGRPFMTKGQAEFNELAADTLVYGNVFTLGGAAFGAFGKIFSTTVGKAGGVLGKGAGKAVELPRTSFTTSKLQHEFKHAGDFGVTGNWNKATGEVYQKAIQNHLDTASDVYKSTYRGQDVNVFINKSTGVGAYTDLSGNYIGGWKFSPDQMNFHLTNGTKIK